MNRNQFRVCNIVAVKGQIVTIEAIFYSSFACSSLDEKTKCSCFYLDVQPVPLTDAILKAAGFEQPLSFTDVYTKMPAFVFPRKDKQPAWGFGFRKGGAIKDINYLHELQNLYFLLSDQELEIDYKAL